MAKVLGSLRQGYVFNIESHIKRNNHKYLLVRANLISLIKRSENIPRQVKIDFVERLNNLSDYLTLDSQSFDSVLSEELFEIKAEFDKHISEYAELNTMLNGIVNYLK